MQFDFTGRSLLPKVMTGFGSGASDAWMAVVAQYPPASLPSCLPCRYPPGVRPTDRLNTLAK